MIEIINIGIAAFVGALIFYSFFTERPWIDIATIIISPLYFTYLIGLKIGSGEFYSAILPLIIFLIFVGTIIWRMHFSEEKEERRYTREELVLAMNIYHKNYLAEPEGFQEIDGTRLDAEVTVDYLLGIIDADNEPEFTKKVEYESRLQPES